MSEDLTKLFVVLTKRCLLVLFLIGQNNSASILYYNIKKRPPQCEGLLMLSDYRLTSSSECELSTKLSTPVNDVVT